MTSVIVWAQARKGTEREDQEMSSMTSEQADFLRKELEKVTYNPENHDQSIWFTVPRTENETDKPVAAGSACGSKGCLAGNAVVHAGFELDFYKDMIFRDGAFKRVWIAEFVKGETNQYGNRVSISEKARELFGLRHWQSEELFNPHNSVERLWELVIDFSGGLITSSHAFQALRIGREKAVKKAVEKAKADVRDEITTAIQNYIKNA